MIWILELSSLFLNPLARAHGCPVGPGGGYPGVYWHQSSPAWLFGAWLGRGEGPGLAPSLPIPGRVLGRGTAPSLSPATNITYLQLVEKEKKGKKKKILFFSLFFLLFFFIFPTGGK